MTNPLYYLALKLLYNATPSDYEISQQPDMIAYDPEVHTWVSPMNPPESIPNPNGSELIFRMWNLPNPQPTFAELDTYLTTAEFYAAWLDRTKIEAYGEIEERTENARAFVITLKPGQIGEYVQKENEVKYWNESGQKSLPLIFDEDDYLIAKAEAQVFRKPGTSQVGITTQEMLAIWEANMNKWATASAYIAATKRAAIVAVDGAATVEQVQAIMAALNFDGLAEILA
ncbi:MAG: hypothetical protein KDJ52_00140 [Anaerolineae bacterium]|nr:hypothetical protein [Anaerolineae bacterium]